MNTEEKILAVLEKMDGRLSKLEDEMAEVKGGLFRMENDHGTRLRALSEEVGIHTEILERIERKVGKLEFRTRSNENAIEILKAK